MSFQSQRFTYDPSRHTTFGYTTNHLTMDIDDAAPMPAVNERNCCIVWKYWKEILNILPGERYFKNLYTT